MMQARTFKAEMVGQGWVIYRGGKYYDGPYRHRFEAAREASEFENYEKEERERESNAA